ncbi:MAG: NADH-quinone oxidoreductase subunit I [Proteobacteria bacterium]|nr:MAG: NADH-quinone oxidoreductase subunit I [Pseudomonadota bacterium]
MSGVNRVFSGLWSLLVGLKVTLGHFGRTTIKRHKVTEVYPHEEPTLPKAYRGEIQLIRFEQTRSHDCVGCRACERICPSFCIKVTQAPKVAGLKKKRAATFTMDFALCSLCGLCIDVCPTDTLEHSRSYDDAGYCRDWKRDLLAPFADFEATFIEEQKAREARAAEEKQRKAAEKRRLAAEAAAAKAAAEAATDDDKEDA